MCGADAPEDDVPEDREQTPVRRVLRDFGYFGYFLHQHRGGRSGKQHLLVLLLKRGSTMTQRELQESSRIASASVSELLAKLEAEGLVTRLRSETDRRQLTITLTPAGAERAREVVRAWRRFDEQALACLDEWEAAELADTLDRVAAHWMELDQRKKGEAACNRG